MGSTTERKMPLCLVGEVVIINLMVKVLRKRSSHQPLSVIDNDKINFHG
jgi:hypothetical protein